MLQIPSDNVQQCDHSIKHQLAYSYPLALRCRFVLRVVPGYFQPATYIGGRPWIRYGLPKASLFKFGSTFSHCEGENWIECSVSQLLSELSKVGSSQGNTALATSLIRSQRHSSDCRTCFCSESDCKTVGHGNSTHLWCEIDPMVSSECENSLCSPFRALKRIKRQYIQGYTPLSRAVRHGNSTHLWGEINPMVSSECENPNVAPLGP